MLIRLAIATEPLRSPPHRHRLMDQQRTRDSRASARRGRARAGYRGTADPPAGYRRAHPTPPPPRVGPPLRRTLPPRQIPRAWRTTLAPSGPGGRGERDHRRRERGQSRQGRCAESATNHRRSNAATSLHRATTNPLRTGDSADGYATSYPAPPTPPSIRHPWHRGESPTCEGPPTGESRLARGPRRSARRNRRLRRRRSPAATSGHAREPKYRGRVDPRRWPRCPDARGQIDSMGLCGRPLPTLGRCVARQPGRSRSGRARDRPAATTADPTFARDLPTNDEGEPRVST